MRNIKNKNLLLLLIICTLLSIQIKGQLSTGTVTVNNDLKFDWSISKQSDSKEYMNFKITTKAKGWVSLGIPEQESGSMPGGDYLVIQYNNGTPTISDMYTCDFVKPTLDDNKSDWVLSEFKKNDDGSFLYSVKRPLDTGDSVQDRPFVKSSIMKLLWAYGDDASLTKHSGEKRGIIKLNLKGLEEVTPADTIITKDYLMNAKIGSVEPTNYIFRSFKVSDDLVNASMIQFEVLEDSGPSRQMLHHLIFYGCKYDGTKPDNAAFKYQKEAGPGNSQLGDSEAGCNQMFFVWALGNPALQLPDGVGFSVGTDTKSVWDYFLIEFHYHNANLQKNVVDNSGIRVTFSKTRKSIEAGVLTIGDSLVSSEPLPPNKKQIVIQQSCQSSCTQQFPHDINVFLEFPHMHGVGKRIITTHYRGGQYLATTTEVDFYQFDNQQTIPVNYQFQKEDSWNVYCVYDTTSRVKETIFSGGSDDEMCMNFIFYYPALQSQPTETPTKFCGYVRFDQNQGSVCGSVLNMDAFDFISPNPEQVIPLSDIKQANISFGNCALAASYSGLLMFGTFITYIFSSC